MEKFVAGQYYGAQAFERQVGNLGFRHLQATIPEHEVREHSHDGAHLVLATRGRYRSSASGDQREGPVLVFNPPNVVHRDCFIGDDGWFFAISLSELESSIFYEQLDLPDYALRFHQPHILKQALNLMRGVAAGETSGLRLEIMTTDLLSQLLPQESLSNNVPGWLKQAQEMIADVPEHQLSVAEIAQEIGVHRVYLARQYLRHFGCAPSFDLQRRRLERATQMIMNGKHSLIEIAYASGFCDQSHMNRAFLHSWKMTPLAFAQLLGAKPNRILELRTMAVLES